MKFQLFFKKWKISFCHIVKDYIKKLNGLRGVKIGPSANDSAGNFSYIRPNFYYIKPNFNDIKPNFAIFLILLTRKKGALRPPSTFYTNLLCFTENSKFQKPCQNPKGSTPFSKTLQNETFLILLLSFWFFALFKILAKGSKQNVKCVMREFRGRGRSPCRPVVNQLTNRAKPCRP